MENVAHPTPPGQSDVEDDLMLAVSREWELPPEADAVGIDARWRQAFLVARFADLLAQLTTGQHLRRLDLADRAWLRERTERFVADVVEFFETAPARAPAMWYRIDTQDARLSVASGTHVLAAAASQFDAPGTVVQTGRFRTPFAIYAREDRLETAEREMVEAAEWRRARAEGR